MLALPALVSDGSDVMIARPLAPLLAMADVPGAVLPLDRGTAGFARAVRELRRRRYRSGVLLSAAFSAAWLFRCGGVRHLSGTRTDGRGWLLEERIEPETLRARHRTDAFRLLLGQKPAEPVTPDAAAPSDATAPSDAAASPTPRGGTPTPPSAAAGPAAHRLLPPAGHVERWRDRLGASRPAVAAPDGPRAEPGSAPLSVPPNAPPSAPRPEPLIALFPGANAPARRWPAERFGEAARALVAAGRRVVVLGGPAERDLTSRVASAEVGALDLGGETDLVDLAAILSLCDLVVTNDTGPMHLAGAVGTPTVSLWGSSDPTEVAQAGSADTRVSGAALPCAPCRRNHCHRRGRGTVLNDARVECMRLIDVKDVVDAAEAALDRGPPREPR